MNYNTNLNSIKQEKNDTKNDTKNYNENEDISLLELNNEISVVILNNNPKINDIRLLLDKFPNCTELYISNMKHIINENLNLIMTLHKLHIINCGITLRSLLYCKDIKHIKFSNLNLECQVTLYSPVISPDEWLHFSSICEELYINSNNLTMDCMKYICESMPNLKKFYVLDIILSKLKLAVKSGYEKEQIEFISSKNTDNTIILNRDIKWKSLLANK